MPRYSREFKDEALDLLKRNGGSVNKTAGQLGIAWRTLNEWVERSEGKSSQDQGDAEKEVVRLRKQLKQAEMEREILKKAVAFFAKQKD